MAVATALVICEPLIDLFVSVSVVARPTSVSVLVGSVSVPVFEIDEIIGSVRVLFASVAVAAFFVASDVLSTFPSPTSPLTIPVGVLMTGLVRVLLVSVHVWLMPHRLDVTPETKPSSVAVTAENETAPPASETRALEAVNAVAFTIGLPLKVKTPEELTLKR